MNPAWSIYSGGRLPNQRLANVSFSIIVKNDPDNPFLNLVSVKQALLDKLRQPLSRVVVDHLPLRMLSMTIQSELVRGEAGILEMELLVCVSEIEGDSMLWYFMLRSPVAHISPDNGDEIAMLIVDRLFAVSGIKSTSID